MKLGRWGWILLAGAVTAVLVVLVEQNEETVADGTEQGGASSQRGERGGADSETATQGGTAAVEDLRLELLVREKSTTEKTNPFSASTWYRPPPPPPPPPPAPPPEAYVPPVPTAPPLPFKYLGSYEEGSKRLILLVKDEEMYTVAEGDVIDNIYRVARIEGNKVDMVYLPLGITQTIDTGESAFSANKKRGQ